MKRLAMFFVVAAAIFAATVVFGCSEDPVGEGGSYIPKADGPGEGGSYVPKATISETNDSSSSNSSSQGSAATGSISG